MDVFPHFRLNFALLGKTNICHFSLKYGYSVRADRIPPGSGLPSQCKLKYCNRTNQTFIGSVKFTRLLESTEVPLTEWLKCSQDDLTILNKASKIIWPANFKKRKQKPRHQIPQSLWATEVWSTGAHYVLPEDCPSWRVESTGLTHIPPQYAALPPLESFRGHIAHELYLTFCITCCAMLCKFNMLTAFWAKPVTSNRANSPILCSPVYCLFRKEKLEFPFLPQGGSVRSLLRGANSI